jgi:hypothetical protein
VQGFIDAPRTVWLLKMPKNVGSDSSDDKEDIFWAENSDEEIESVDEMVKIDGAGFESIEIFEPFLYLIYNSRF